MDAVEILESLRGCFPDEDDICGELWKKWEELKDKYLDGPGWIWTELERDTGKAFSALEYVPVGFGHVLPDGRLEVYPDLKSDTWWSTDIPLDQFDD